MPLIETALRQGLPGADVYVEAMSVDGPVNPRTRDIQDGKRAGAVTALVATKAPVAVSLGGLYPGWAGPPLRPTLSAHRCALPLAPLEPCLTLRGMEDVGRLLALAAADLNERGIAPDLEAFAETRFWQGPFLSQGL